MQKAYREVKTELQFEKVDNLDFAAHMHDDIEVMYIKNGHGIAYCDGKKYSLTENSFFVAFPNQVHRYMESSMGKFILLVIKPSMLLGYGELFVNSEAVSNVYKFEKNSDDNIVWLLETALSEYERDGHSTIIDVYLTAFFGKLMKHFTIKQTHTSNDIIAQTLHYCTQHYKENITVGDIANELHVSRSCISHIFSNIITMNFCEYINSLRLTDAMNSIKNTDYSITEIAEKSGFSTIRTFNRAFRKQYGTSPSEYRSKL